MNDELPLKQFCLTQHNPTAPKVLSSTMFALLVAKDVPFSRPGSLGLMRHSGAAMLRCLCQTVRLAGSMWMRSGIRADGGSRRCDQLSSCWTTCRQVSTILAEAALHMLSFCNVKLSASRHLHQSCLVISAKCKLEGNRVHMLLCFKQSGVRFKDLNFDLALDQTRYT